jgi:hypothetical protein
VDGDAWPNGTCSDGNVGPATFSWELVSGDGVKTVWVRYRHGSDSVVVSDSITLASVSYTATWQRPLLHATTAPFPIVDIKNGRVVPGKVTISDGTDPVTGDGATPPVVTIFVSGIACDGAGVDTPDSTYADAGQSSAGTDRFRWDGDAEQWVYNLDTKGLGLTVGHCYKLEASVDGTLASGFAVIRPVK